MADAAAASREAAAISSSRRPVTTRAASAEESARGVEGYPSIEAAVSAGAFTDAREATDWASPPAPADCARPRPTLALSTLTTLAAVDDGCGRGCNCGEACSAHSVGALWVETSACAPAATRRHS